MQLRKISIPKLWKVIGNSKGVARDVSKAKILKERYETKLEFPEGKGLKPKSLLFRVEIFFGNTYQCHYHPCHHHCYHFSNRNSS